MNISTTLRGSLRAFGVHTAAVTAAVACLSLASSCDPYSPNLGDNPPFRCGTDEPRCPDGFTCVEYSATDTVCVKSGDAPRPDGGNADVDAPSQLECAFEELEPNESITDPTITPIPDFGPDYELVGLQICPDTDVDVYRFRIDITGKNVKVDINYRSSQGELVLDILNSTGTTIIAGTAVVGNPDILRGEVPNLASGTYYAQVRSASGVRNNYDIDIVVTGP